MAVLTPRPAWPAPAPRATPGSPPWRGLLGWLAVTAVTAALVRLPGAAGIDPDGHASVLYFDRLTSGQRLEDPLLSTPKPLLTLSYGLAWALTGDWRALTLLTVAVFALAVVALARSAGRLGGWPAGGFTVLALVGSGPLVLQVSRGNSTVWALAGWAVAVDALARPARRWAVAAAALLLAALARTETWLLLPAAALWAVIAWRRGERRALLLLAPLAAPVLWALHDLALTGDPLFSPRTPERYTTLVSGWHPVAPADWAWSVGERYAHSLLLSGLALVGAAWLARRRAWLWLGGLGLLFAGVLALLGVYAWRGVYVSWRYYDPADLAVRLTAAFGAAGLARLLTGRLAKEAGRTVAGTVAAGLLAAVACWPLAPADPEVRTTLDRNGRLSANAATAVTVLRPLVAVPGAPVVLASGPQRIRVAVELDRPLTQVRDLPLSGLAEPSLDRVLAGSVAVFHDADADWPVARFAPLSTTAETRIGGVRVVPVHVDPGQGLYVLRVERAHEP